MEIPQGVPLGGVEQDVRSFTLHVSDGFLGTPSVPLEVEEFIYLKLFQHHGKINKKLIEDYSI